jgi:hypothetical protein
MRSRIATAMLLFGVVLASGACATSEQWSEWGQNKTHFASGKHAFFSVRNREDSKPRVTRSDVEIARSESWWGTPVMVSADKILQK